LIKKKVLLYQKNPNFTVFWPWLAQNDQSIISTWESVNEQ